MKAQRGLATVFTATKRTFFPRWDQKNCWRVQRNPRLPCSGECDLERRLIVVRRVHRHSLWLQLILIHEICHALSTVSHGRVWQARMTRVATAAERHGMRELARLIRQEIAAYASHADTSSPADVYRRIEARARQDAEVTWRDVKRRAARALGLRESEVLEHFPRARFFFEKGRRRTVRR